MKYKYLLPLALLIAASCSHKEKETSGTPEINVAEAVQDSVVLTKDYPGFLEATSSADVVGEVSGRLLSRNFTPGTYVQKGQVLFTIESTKYLDAVQEASATLASAKSGHEYYTSQTEAMRTAYQQDAVSKMEMLQAENSLHQAEAQIRNAQAALENAQTMLNKCTVRAPISGYITMEDVTPGNYINGEGNPQKLATIYDNSKFHAVISIDDEHYRDIVEAREKGGSLLFKAMKLNFDNPLPHQYTADLYYEAPSVSKTTGTLNLIGDVTNIDNELKDGMYVSVSLPYGVSPKAVLVKDAALSTDQLGKYLYVVNDSNKVVYTPVTVGQVVRDSLRVIEKGIKPGQKYVTQALLTVRNGMTVKPKVVK